jgi:hypothetical protein
MSNTLTKMNDRWILKKAFVTWSYHFVISAAISVGVFGQTICSKRGTTTAKKKRYKGCLG